MANPRTITRLSRRLRLSQLGPSRQNSSIPPPTPRPIHDPHALLSTPTWSIRTLPPSDPNPSLSASTATPTSTSTPTLAAETQQQQQQQPPPPPSITPAQLTHLHNLSSLPPPGPSSTPTILSTLHSPLHFVRNIQLVNTEGIAPLHSIRDETEQGLAEATITTTTLQEALADEETYGKHKRPRRRRGAAKVDGAGLKGVEDWDVLGAAGEKVGRYFVVRSGKGEVKEE
jgi:hypothetical protein